MDAFGYINKRNHGYCEALHLCIILAYVIFIFCTSWIQVFPYAKLFCSYSFACLSIQRYLYTIFKVGKQNLDSALLMTPKKKYTYDLVDNTKFVKYNILMEYKLYLNI